MNGAERRYPDVFKFAMVALMGFSVYIFFHSADLMVQLYSVIMFFAVLNGWAASEDTRFRYGDLYLLVDAICAAMYFISLLDLNEGQHKYFWVYSGITFFMYWIWNKLMIIEGVQTFQNLKVYNRCDIFACFCSFAIFISIMVVKSEAIIRPIQYFGMILWVGLLFKWYYDFYLKSFKKSETAITSKTKQRKGGTKP